jgi:hypothetical protein
MRAEGRVALLALSGLMAMTVGAECAPWSKGLAKRKVTLFVDGMGCQHEVEPKPVKLEMKKPVAIGWRIQNDCGIARKVLLCVYDAQGKLASPFDACTTAPAGLALGSPLTLAADGGQAELDCPAKTAGNYLAAVFVGDEVRASGCPAAPPKERAVPAGDRTFTHRLAIEIVP